MSVNKVIIIGHLGSNPELRHTTSGHSVTRFNVATNEYWKSKTGEQNEKTEWHRIVAWGRLGEVCHQHLTKGRQVYLEGRLQTRSWEDNQNVKKYSTEIIASTVQFLGANDQKICQQLCHLQPHHHLKILHTRKNLMWRNLHLTRHEQLMFIQMFLQTT